MASTDEIPENFVNSVILGDDQFNTIISVPFLPEEFGILLPPSSLRRIDFSALDFEALRRATSEYVRTYFPEDFNDFFLSNGFIMFMEIVSSVGNILSERSDIIADEAFLPTAQSRNSVSQHLELIGQEFRRATPAVTDVECSIAVPTNFDITIPAGLSFSISGPDGSPVNYELYSAPGDYTGSIIIPRNARGVIAFAIEGKFASPIEEISSGEDNQMIEIVAPNVLNDPITVDVTSGDDTVRWERVKFLETAGPNDEVYAVKFLEDRALVLFGDNATGKTPLSGQVITINYRVGGGIRGRIGTGTIDESRPIGQDGFATQNVQFRNIVPSRGGQDEESIETAKQRAPRDFAVHGNVATSDDYNNVSESFSHPVYGSVEKASASVRSGIGTSVEEVVKAVRAAPTEEEAAQFLLGNYVNRNIVDLYILQEGTTDIPVTPNNGLKTSLKTSLSDINVFTDDIDVKDGLIRAIDVEAVIVVSRNVDASIVQERVQAAIESVFNIDNHEMGQAFIRSTLITAIQVVDGVLAVDLFAPADDLPSLREPIPSGTPEEDRPPAIGINELWVLGAQKIQFFLEHSNTNL